MKTNRKITAEITPSKCQSMHKPVQESYEKKPPKEKYIGKTRVKKSDSSIKELDKKLIR